MKQIDTLNNDLYSNTVSVSENQLVSFEFQFHDAKTMIYRINDLTGEQKRIASIVGERFHNYTKEQFND